MWGDTSERLLLWGWEGWRGMGWIWMEMSLHRAWHWGRNAPNAELLATPIPALHPSPAPNPHLLLCCI